MSLSPISGIADVVSIHTALVDWKSGASFGGPPWDEVIARQSAALLDRLERALPDIRDVSEAGMRELTELFVAETDLCLWTGHSRPEEGTEHFLAYCVEDLTRRSFVHGELVCLCIVVMSVLQGHAPGSRPRMVRGAGVRAHPQQIGLSEADLVRALMGVSDYVKGEGLFPSAVTQAPVAGARAPDGRFKEFNAWYKAYPATEPDAILRIEDPCQMTYTSGTESLPKGVIISNQALIAQYMGCIIDGGYDATDINVNALPIYHCAQRDVFLNPIIWLGGTNVLMVPDIGRILKSIADYRASMFFAPPTVWIGMLRHPDFGKHDLSSLKKCYYGASIMPVEVLKEMLERLPGAKIYNYYGPTELAPYHTILKAADPMAKLGSAGMGGLNMETQLEEAVGDPIKAPWCPR